MQEEPDTHEIVPLTSQDQADISGAIQFEYGPSFSPGTREFQELVNSPTFLALVRGCTGVLTRILLSHGFEPDSVAIRPTEDRLEVRARRPAP